MCTDREREILREIVECIQSKGYPPSVRELVEALGAKAAVSPNPASTDERHRMALARSYTQAVEVAS